MILTPELISANLGYRPWMGRHVAHSFYAWPKVVFVSHRKPMEPVCR